MWLKATNSMTNLSILQIPTLTDHILAIFPSRVSQKGVITLCQIMSLFFVHKIAKFLLNLKQMVFTSTETFVHLKPIRLMIIKGALDNYSSQTTESSTKPMQHIHISFRKS